MSRPILLDERCRVIPGEDVLYVLTRRGFHEVRGRGVDRLHRRLRPHLGGERTEAELLAAVPPSRRQAVGRYLERLRELGVLREGRPAAEPAAPRVRFVAPEEAAALLLLPWGTDGGPEPLTAVVVEGGAEPAGEEERRERSAYARWLRRNTADVRPADEVFRLFRLDGATGALERLVSVGGRADRDLGSVPEQLGVVRPAAVDQVPLVVATAAHPLFAPRVTGYGLSEPAVRAELLRRFTAELLRPEPAPSQRTPPPLVGSSPRELELRRRDREAGRRAARGGGVRWEEADLLAEPTGHPVVAHLQEVLRLRSPGLPGRRGRTPDGASVRAAGELQACSLLPEKALAELLLREVWRTCYPGGVPGEAAVEAAVPVLDLADFASGEELRGLLDEPPDAPRAPHREPRREPRRVGAWGRALYLEEGGDGGEDHLRRRALG